MASKSRISFKLPSRHGPSGYSLFRRAGHRRIQAETLRKSKAKKSDTTLRSPSSILSEELNKRYLKLVDDWKRSLTKASKFKRTPESFGICLPETRESSEAESSQSSTYLHEPYMNSTERHKFFPCIPVIIWASLRSSVARAHGKAGQLESLQQKMLDLSEAVDAMQRMSHKKLAKLGRSPVMGSNISVDEFLYNVEEREIGRLNIKVINI